jgi:hypothetical protein
MHSSSFHQPLPKDLLNNAAVGHQRNGKPLEVKRYVYPNMAAGGLWTTSTDYAKYIIEIQKSYHGESNLIVSQELTKLMLSSHVSEQYGLGVFIREIHGEKNYFGHLGDNRGFFAGFVSHLTDGYGAVVLTNSQNGAGIIREITNGIARIYGWKKYLPKEYKIVETDPEILDQYCGRYLLGADNYFQIKKEQNKLYINRFDGARLYHVGDNKFVTKFRKGYLQFLTNSDQSVTSVYYFSDELGRFLHEPLTCRKMNPEMKIPMELLNEGNITEAVNAYRKIKKENPSDFYVSENRLNILGYRYLGQHKYQQALAIFKLNVEFYPESANCYDSLGEAYMKNGNTELAIKNYRKSLELNPNNQNAERKLKVLINKP